MNRYNLWDNIANGFNAANKVRDVYNSSLREEQNLSVRASNVTLLLQMLSAISEYSPEPHREVISRAVDRCNLYNCTYKDLKRHFGSMRGQSPSFRNFTETLGIIRPILDNGNKSVIDKILKIYEILST